MSAWSRALVTAGELVAALPSTFISPCWLYSTSSISTGEVRPAVPSTANGTLLSRYRYLVSVSGAMSLIVAVMPACCSWLCSCSASEFSALVAVSVIDRPCGYPAAASSCLALATLCGYRLARLGS